MGVHHSVIDCLMQRLQATGMVDEHLRSDCPRKTTIICVCLCIVVPNTYCSLPLSCVPYVASFSGLSISDCPFGILSPLLSMPREDRLIAHCTSRRNRFPTSGRIRDKLNFGGNVYIRLYEQSLCARRPMKWTQL
jgi:hypothetical protein